MFMGDVVSEGNSDNVDAHSKAESLKVHSAAIDGQNEFTEKDRWIRPER